MGDGSCWVDILIKSWPAISGDGNEIANKCGDSECCAAEIFCDLLLLQEPDSRAWWYQESPSLEIWGRGLKENGQNPDSGSKNSENQNNDTVLWKKAQKYHFVGILWMLITLANFCGHHQALEVVLPSEKKFLVNWTSGVQVMAVQRGLPSNWSQNWGKLTLFVDPSITCHRKQIQVILTSGAEAITVQRAFMLKSCGWWLPMRF